MTAADIAVLDYGSGNVRSVVHSLQKLGATVELTSRADIAESAGGLVVPGVGAFGACMDGLRGIQGPRIIERRLVALRPTLGICVGMQVMFDNGIERGIDTPGCGQWPGTVEPIQAPILPHMGWNTIEVAQDSQMFVGLAGQRFYFVHSYGVRRWDMIASAFEVPQVSWSKHHGDRFIAAIENGPLWATQFHPEKSGETGAGLLENWLNTIG